MKLDSEEQRNQLISLLSGISVNVTYNTIDATKKQMEILLSPIRKAEIESLVEND